ncbi:uncharacterized protein BKCO1_6100036 [Diplodia corticola]|uniref:Uncharacterized protein n=1 Tax=Diplodia corticola TaxID=236234 RepID=A0A1J9RR93_9PEZI|nr:uncharacterized protein BKCO1_6100036 [Diplodia corticola]OJD30420.1 hypothetical protein BKCO1_6100036 [Diplodia corticola]
MNDAQSVAKKEAEGLPQETATLEETLDILNTLEAMANSYLDTFNAKILNPGGDVVGIPIDKVVARTRFVRTYSSHPETIPEELQNCIKSLVSGPMEKDIKNIAENACRQLSGTSPGQRAVVEQSAISLDDILGLCRLDVGFFSHNIKSRSVPGTYETVLACCIVVSSVAVADLEESTLRVIVRNSFHSYSPAVKKLVYDELYWKIIRKRDEAGLTEEEQGELRNHKANMDDYWNASKK